MPIIHQFDCFPPIYIGFHHHHNHHPHRVLSIVISSLSLTFAVNLLFSIVNDVINHPEIYSLPLAMLSEHTSRHQRVMSVCVCVYGCITHWSTAWGIYIYIIIIIASHIAIETSRTYIAQLRITLYALHQQTSSSDACQSSPVGFQPADPHRITSLHLLPSLLTLMSRWYNIITYSACGTTTKCLMALTLCTFQCSYSQNIFINPSNHIHNRTDFFSTTIPSSVLKSTTFTTLNISSNPWPHNKLPSKK